MPYYGRALVCVVIVQSVIGIRLSGQSGSELEPFLDSRKPFLANIDYNRLYCFDSAASAPSSLIASTTATVVSCRASTDCPAATPFCMSNVCRECRYASDCPPATSFMWTQNVCSEDTTYACSECTKDTDCVNSKICRGVSDPFGIDRKRCVSCSADSVPEDAVMRSAGSCDWFCADPTDMIGPDGKCSPGPQCLDGQMLIPTEDFALSTPRSFFSSTSMANNPRCVNCPAINNPCASLLSPTTNWAGTVGVGFLPPQYACGTFKCKSDWWLDTSINQCRQCDYRSCPSGQQLVGCGVATAGTCQGCTGPGPFINPRDLSYSISTSIDACKPQCNDNQVLVRTNATTPWICQVCGGNEVCPPGYMFSGCGGPNPGQCLQCAPMPPPGSFWSGPGCSVSVCDPSVCLPGQRLVGCGGSAAGQCQPCPASLPANAVSYSLVYDEETLSRDTCGVTCASGYFARRSPSDVSVYECVQCDPSVCAASQTLIGCGGTQPGTCQSCPVPNPGLYIAGPGCTTSQCPLDSSVCSAGQKFYGCGGTNAGACIACGPLPNGASAWVPTSPGSDLWCDFNCQPGFYSNVTFGFKTCVDCNAIAATTCAVGQVLTGCSATSPGVCRSCAPVNETTYWTGGTNCTTGSCLARGCAPGAIALGCGLTSAGTCTSCSALNSLPQLASGWIAINNQCLPVCQAGAYRTPAGTCQVCDLTRCANGFVLSGCGDTSMGQCVACTNGQCYAGFGLTLSDTTSCPTAQCPVAI